MTLGEDFMHSAFKLSSFTSLDGDIGITEETSEIGQQLYNASRFGQIEQVKSILKTQASAISPQDIEQAIWVASLPSQHVWANVNAPDTYVTSEIFFEIRKLLDRALKDKMSLTPINQALHRLDKLGDNKESPLGLAAYELRKEILKAFQAGHINDADIPILTNVINAASDCVEKPTKQNLEKYESELTKAESTSIARTPWKKTKIGLMCAGIGMIVAGLVLFPFCFPIGMLLVLAGAVLTFETHDTYKNKNSLFKSAEDLRDKLHENITDKTSNPKSPSPASVSA